ncbi:gamma-glutamylcyclotransferase family protein [Acidicapsa dinghuensis]|uniref:Gamma-glutamylcyclotransferase family protein n=1 Tax=Acidicapsa dinghuensis TaxID=2218256 RepID=A0ABW1EML9_9BACT|nr:gamma-glutamylcyclotransferase family protein [Acidicapsa dinghuensis]
MQEYIFGIGSLIEQASRMRTTPAARYVLPARVRGYVRGWWARTGSIGFTTTFVGAIPQPSASINGVVYAVSEEELKASNKREQGYTPTDITSAIEMLTGGPAPKGRVWMYVNDFKPGQREQSLPTAQFPIVQSYVDICLTGCLQIEEGFPETTGFAGEFITSTQEWSKYWENDRVNPRRPFTTVPLFTPIDKLLQKHLPTLFTEIQLAPGRW